MSDIALEQITKSLSLVLRHNKEKALTIDERGFAVIDELCSYLSTLSRYPDGFKKEWIAAALEDPSKKRFGLSADGRKIRALSGHSFKIDLGYAPYHPKGSLYFGTSNLSADEIIKHGLTKSTKVKVRLVESIDHALDIAKTREGEPLIVAVNAEALVQDGFRFELAESGEILSDKIPAEYCSIVEISATPSP